MGEGANRVLVVDDERFFREAICDALGAESIECLTAERAETALQLAKRQEVGVVVLDIGLPEEGGLELLRQLEVERPELRVIVISSQGDEDRVLEALRLGACDYLAKPLHDEELVLAVRRALTGYEVQSSWESLRSRLVTLEGRLAELASVRSESDEQLANRAAQAVADVLGASKASLMLLDSGDRELRVIGVAGRELAPAEMDPVAVGMGVAGVALQGGESLLVSDVRSDERFSEAVVEGRYSSPSFAISPFSADGRFLGVLCATDRLRSGPFHQEDLSLLRVLALHVGPLFGEAASSAQREPLAGEAANAVQAGSAAEADREGSDDIDDAELARAICDVLTSEIEPDRLIRGVLSTVAQSLTAAPVSLYLVGSGGELVREGQCERAGSSDREILPVNAGLTGTVLQTGRLIATDSPERDPRFRAEVDTPADGVAGPMLCVPVRLKAKTLGVLRAFASKERGISARTGEVLTAAISAAVRNVLMYRSLLESVDEVARARRETKPPSQAVAR